MVGTFPLNVQEGSPQYTLTSQITPSSSTTTISITNTDPIDPISNAYYTIQNEDGSKWCTFYIAQWTTDSTNNYTGTCTYSSSNTSDVFPEGSVCWCVWTKEYYESITTSISTVNTEISTINNEIDYLTPKVDNSFVSATKTDDTTLRLTRNDGTTVDISFPEGINERNVNLTSWQNITANTNEIVLITGSFIGNEIYHKTLRVTGIGYLEVIYTNRNGSITRITLSKGIGGYDFTGAIYPTTKFTISGLVFNGGKVTAT